MFSLPFPTFLLSDMKLKVLAMLARLAVPLEALYYGALRFVNFKYEIAEVDRYYIHTYIHTNTNLPLFVSLIRYLVSCSRAFLLLTSVSWSSTSDLQSSGPSTWVIASTFSAMFQISELNMTMSYESKFSYLEPT